MMWTFALLIFFSCKLTKCLNVLSDFILAAAEVQAILILSKPV